jgi:hypothetical protein
MSRRRKHTTTNPVVRPFDVHYDPSLRTISAHRTQYKYKLVFEEVVDALTAELAQWDGLTGAVLRVGFPWRWNMTEYAYRPLDPRLSLVSLFVYRGGRGLRSPGLNVVIDCDMDWLFNLSMITKRLKYYRAGDSFDFYHDSLRGYLSVQGLTAAATLNYFRPTKPTGETNGVAEAIQWARQCRDHNPHLERILASVPADIQFFKQEQERQEEEARQRWRLWEEENERCKLQQEQREARLEELRARRVAQLEGSKCAAHCDAHGRWWCARCPQDQCRAGYILTQAELDGRVAPEPDDALDGYAGYELALPTQTINSLTRWQPVRSPTTLYEGLAYRSRRGDRH